MPEKRETHPIEIAGIYRELPLFEVAPGVRIAVLNILGDIELVEACAEALADQLASQEYDVLVTAEAKSIPLIHALAVKTRKPYVVLRKVYRPYMGEALSAETHSITTGRNQCLYLDEKDRSLLAGKKVVLLDDVISTGSTLRAMEQLMRDAQATVTEEAGILTEGDQQQWMHIVALGHVPIFTDWAASEFTSLFEPCKKPHRS